MARPTKCRRICHFPAQTEFAPSDGGRGEPIVMSFDEYEALRLIDLEGLSQEECGERMQIARTTAQKICESARRKLALMLSEGRELRIEGGEVTLCGGGGLCGLPDCEKPRVLSENFENEKGDTTMRIAATYQNGNIFGHFGHTETFKIYDVEDNKIVKSGVIGTNGSGHGALAELLHALKVEVLICGGIGPGAVNALTSAKIKVCAGASGSADAAVEAYLGGTLVSSASSNCDHHGEGHEHNCGSHGCGSHGCKH